MSVVITSHTRCVMLQFQKVIDRSRQSGVDSFFVMSGIKIKEIEGVNQFSIEPACCGGWLARMESLVSKGVVNESGEVLYELVAEHPGTGDIQEVVLYLKS